MKSLNGRTRTLTVWEDKTSRLNHSDPSMSRLKWRWSGEIHPNLSLFYWGYHRGNCVTCHVPRHWDIHSDPCLANRSMPRRSTTGQKWLLGWFSGSLKDGPHGGLDNSVLTLNGLKLETWWRPVRFGLLLIVHPPSANHLRSSIFHWLHFVSHSISFVQDLCKLRIVPWLPLTWNSLFGKMGSWERCDSTGFRGRDAAPLEAAWSQLSIQQIWKELGEMEGMTKRRSARNMDKEWTNHIKTHWVIGFGKRVFAECRWFEAHQPLRHYHSQVGPLDSHSTVRNHLSHGHLAAFGW